jgi:hypothetical protein
MTANVHPETGISYGTIYGSRVQDLVNDIMEQGEDLTFAAWKCGMASRLENNLDELDEESYTDEIRQAIVSAIKAESNVGDERATQYADDLVPEIHETLEGGEKPDYDELVVSLLDAGLNDYLEFDEPDYDWAEQTDHGMVKYHLSWLGGAILVWVNESPWVIGCRQCSPCVPNAGNLEDPGDDTANCLAYSLPPDRLPEGYEGKPHLWKPDEYLKGIMEHE